MLYRYYIKIIFYFKNLYVNYDLKKGFCAGKDLRCIVQSRFSDKIIGLSWYFSS